MSTLVVVLRILPLLAFAAAMLRSTTRHRRDVTRRARSNVSNRAPLMANVAAFFLYVASLVAFSGSSASPLLASSGALLAIAGVALVVRSRVELGSAWSLMPKADHATGLVPTGPYRLVRHPIYLGLALFATGEALAFGNWAAIVMVLCGILPTLAWRARTEEVLLRRTFGERYARYGKERNMIIPYVL
jgi:protein-S-isoprenylcysteine O-methyltransferase Ste14